MPEELKGSEQPLFNTLLDSVVEKFNSQLVYPETKDPYGIYDAASETVLESDRDAMEMCNELLANSLLKPDETRFNTLVEGTEYTSWDDVFKDIACVLLEEEVRKRFPNLDKEDVMRWEEFGK